jgi:hypothetical protein
MTTFTITLSDGRTAAVDGDDITSRSDGSLWILRAPPKPLPMTPVLILARGQRTSVSVEGAQVLFTGEPTPATNAPPPTPRFA